MVTKSQIKLAKLAGEPAQAQLFSKLVSELIRKKYSVNAELAILRQRDSKPVEFAEYNAYAEVCKAKAKAAIYEESKE
jgi:hypothetical protein